MSIACFAVRAQGLLAQLDATGEVLAHRFQLKLGGNLFDADAIGAAGDQAESSSTTGTVRLITRYVLLRDRPGSAGWKHMNPCHRT